MNDKPRDIPYFNVDIGKVKNGKPIFNEENLVLLNHYINERYKIHIRKDFLKQKPLWTDDIVLQTYKFTNVRREHDRTTRWLVEKISNNSRFTLEDRIYRTLLFRIYNRIETVDMLKLDEDNFFTDDVYSKSKYRLSVDCDFRYFTNAYKTGGTTAGLKSLFPDENKKELRPVLLLMKLREDNFAEKLLCSKDPLEVLSALRGLKGSGNFLSYQFFVDMTYINEFPFSENEFVVSGPGCNYGLRFLLEDHDSMSDEEIIFWIRDHIGEEFNRRGLEWNLHDLMIDEPEEERKLNVQMLENVMCEFQKYTRATKNISKPRNKYRY